MPDIWETERSKRAHQGDVQTRRLYKRFSLDVTDPAFKQRVWERSNLSAGLTAPPDCLLVPESHAAFIPDAAAIEKRFAVRLLLVPNFAVLAGAAVEHSPVTEGTSAPHRDEEMRASWAAVVTIRLLYGDTRYVLAIRRGAASPDRSFGLVGGALRIRGIRRHLPTGTRPEDPNHPDELRFRASSASIADFEHRYRTNADGLFDCVEAAAPDSLVRELIEELVLEDSRLFNVVEAKRVFVDGGLVTESLFREIANDA